MSLPPTPGVPPHAQSGGADDAVTPPRTAHPFRGEPRGSWQPPDDGLWRSGAAAASPGGPANPSTPAGLPSTPPLRQLESSPSGRICYADTPESRAVLGSGGLVLGSGAPRNLPRGLKAPGSKGKGPGSARAVRTPDAPRGSPRGVATPTSRGAEHIGARQGQQLPIEMRSIGLSIAGATSPSASPRNGYSGYSGYGSGASPRGRPPSKCAPVCQAV